MKVNLGSGPDGVRGWKNFDWGWLPLVNKLGLTKLLVKLNILDKKYITKWPEFEMADIRNKLPIEDKSADWVYCSHVIEHLEKFEAEKLIKEIKRILKIGGKARLVVPDLTKMIKLYGNSPDEFNRKFFGYDKDKIRGWQKKLIRGHEWMYTEKSLIDLLKKNDFKKVEVSKYRKSKMPDVKKLDLKIHKDLSLYVEAEK